MHLSHIPQCTIQNRNVHISVLNGALWDMGQVHCGICEIGQFHDNQLQTASHCFENYVNLHPGGHNEDYLTGALSISAVTATHLKMVYL